MTMPNFLLIGAGRAGTTSVYYYLGQHPEIYMSPVKEPNFFADEGHDYGQTRGRHDTSPFKTIEAYRTLFASVTGERAIGEASPKYLPIPRAAERIRYYVPGARLIAILREPVGRAYSAYLKYIRDGIETRTFTEAVRKDLIQRDLSHWLGAEKDER